MFEPETLDAINAFFELGGAAAICLTIRKTYRAKTAKEVSIPHLLFFLLWGGWNASVYYWGLGQWMSWAGGVAIMIANAVLVYLLALYTWRERKAERSKKDAIRA